ncbi:cohesin domain-containing protein, partial [Candidatus Latescibacterota bacterium]
MRKLFATIIFSLLLIFSIGVGFVWGQSNSLSIQDVTVYSGSNANVSINLANTVAVAGIQLEITFDNSVIAPVSVAKADIESSRTSSMDISASVNSNKIIVLIYSLSGLSIPSGTGSILEIDFSTPDVDSETATPLGFAKGLLSDESNNSLSVSLDEGSVTILPELNSAEQDSLALVALYNSTNGPSWSNKTNWLTAATISEWYGVTFTENRVTELDLKSNNLSGTIPLEIGNLTNLSLLNLSGNGLSGTIPLEIGNLTNLNSMNFSYNNITGTIPSEIGYLINLKSLFLTNNELSGSIPPEIGNLINLTSLSLSGNKLSGTIPSVICNINNITYLSLEWNQLTGTIPF